MKTQLQLDALTTTNEFVLHQLGAICGDDIFVLRFESIALQVQALVASVEELTKQN